MKDEIYDIFDESGVKTGTASWTKVHTEGLLHQVAYGILFESEELSRTLVKKRSEDSEQGPGEYEISVSGHILSGETPEQGLRKELQEELLNKQAIPTNIIIEKVTTYHYTDFPNNNEIIHLYKIIHPGPFTIEVKETELIKWVDWDDLLVAIKSNSHKYSDYSINAINEYVKHSIKLQN